jgi:hypothetical protein
MENNHHLAKANHSKPSEDLAAAIRLTNFQFYEIHDDVLRRQVSV